LSRLLAPQSFKKSGTPMWPRNPGRPSGQWPASGRQRIRIN
jgi:hypothetical protein